MKTLLRQISELLGEMLHNSEDLRKIALIDQKLDHVLLNQETLAAYLGMIPGSGATPEELDALGARIRESKDQIEQFNQTTTS